MKRLSLEKLNKLNKSQIRLNKLVQLCSLDYLGLTVEEITDLRVKLHKEDCELKVIKNNILKRAAEKLDIQI